MCIRDSRTAVRSARYRTGYTCRSERVSFWSPGEFRIRQHVFSARLEGVYHEPWLLQL